jgi:tRNA A37 threonylcarbamoyltransferase TsaD
MQDQAGRLAHIVARVVAEPDNIRPQAGFAVVRCGMGSWLKQAVPAHRTVAAAIGNPAFALHWLSAHAERIGEHNRNAPRRVVIVVDASHRALKAFDHNLHAVVVNDRTFYQTRQYRLTVPWNQNPSR